jgi:hypothetical protein
MLVRRTDPVGEFRTVDVGETLAERLDQALQGDLRIDETPGGGGFGHRTPRLSSC